MLILGKMLQKIIIKQKISETKQKVNQQLNLIYFLCQYLEVPTFKVSDIIS